MAAKERPVTASDRELVSKAQEGDASAFEELVHRYDRKVLSIAYSFTRDRDEANDIYQDVFLRAHRALKSFEFGSEFSTWLHRIVMNVCLTHKKRASAAMRTPLDEVPEEELRNLHANPTSVSHAAPPDRMTQDAEIRRHIDDALDALSPQERLVFTLKHFEGYKIREIAAVMGCADGTVKRYLFTATAKMKREMKRVYD